MRIKRAKTAIVLGCGPAGLFAAHAAVGMGWAVTIISNKRRSEMYGAQYLHSAIPGLTDGCPSFPVEYRLEGGLDDYLEKVYGEVPDRSGVSEADLNRKEDAWDIRVAYSRAFALYVDRIDNHTVGPDTIEALFRLRPDLIVNTIPAKALCVEPDRHAFDVRQVWAIGDAPERGVFAPTDTPEGVIQYDGTPDRGWYRAARINGYGSIEWPDGARPPVADVSRIQKPVATTCDCWTGKNVLRLGRYGRWDRRAHAHEAYWETLERCGGKS